MHALEDKKPSEKMKIDNVSEVLFFLWPKQKLESFDWIIVYIYRSEKCSHFAFLIE